MTAAGAHGWRLALPLATKLGEGLHWDVPRQRLWLVDVHGCRLVRWQLDAPEWTEWSSPQRLGWVLPETGRETVLLGLQEGIARVQVTDALRILEWLVRPFGDRPSMRLNDAKRDASGAIWFGSLNNDDESRSDGGLYRFDPDGRLNVVDTGYTIANGPALSPDGRLMLHTDSGRRTIYAFERDAATGQLDARRVWRYFAEDEGYPDGMCFDAQGYVWIAHWGAACVSRFDATGRLVHRVALPTPRITNVCFAGDDLQRIFVTSASNMAADPDDSLGGSLFEIRETCGASGFCLERTVFPAS